MALVAKTNSAAQRNNSTDFSAALTPLEFVAKYGKAQWALGETKNKGLLALSCKDNRGVITSAYASEKLQAEFASAKQNGKTFVLPESVMVAPWTGEAGRKNWTLYMQADLDQSAGISSAVEQKLAR